MTLRDSADSRVSGACVQTRTGRKWSASTSVDQAESKGSGIWEARSVDEMGLTRLEIIMVGTVEKRPGETAEAKKPVIPSLLDRGRDWELKVDMDGRLVFLGIVEKTLLPDMALTATQSKILILVELTVPWEENCEEAHERKNLKYADLTSDCREKGWKVWMIAVEVGCSGFKHSR
ncbi:uncharacterized protein LOC117339230 [Pecten maximus]|uniref:uncharacterized protein LOC117339230 n=1 Tax=Pecten maximus TaxID=6579 RepID=UPI00145851E9|nr:uncharacterized protein LOC117339230 [Pecten maximus]